MRCIAKRNTSKRPPSGPIARMIPLRILFLTATGLLAVACSPRDVAAQLTVKSVLKDLVPEINPKHEDVVAAIEKFRQRDFDGAQELLDSACTADPTLPPPSVLLARMEWQIQRFDSALSLLDRAVSEYPGEPEPYLMFGEHALANDRITEADLLFAKTLVLAESFNQGDFRRAKTAARAHAGLAEVARQRKDWPQAAKHCHAWNKIDPENALALRHLGEALFKQDQTEAALAAFRKAATLDETLPSANVTIAILHQEAGNHDVAAKFIEKSLEDDGSQLATVLMVGRWLLDAQRFDEALAYLDKGSETFLDSADVRVLAAMAAAKLDQTKAALGHLQIALELDPKNFQALNQMALLLIEDQETNAKRRAVEHAEISAALFPENPVAGVTLGWVYHQTGRLAQSQDSLAKAFRAGAVPPDASYYVARIFYDRGRKQDAAQLLEGALRGNTSFLHRTDARNLLEQIQGNQVQAP